MRRKPLLLRLASSETLVATVRKLQLKLSRVAKDLHRADKREVTRWEQQWDADRGEQYGKLNELGTGASERMLVNELRDDKKLKGVLMSLNSGMKWKDQGPEMLAFKQSTFSRVSGFLNGARGPRVVDPRRRTDHPRIAGNSRLIGETSSESDDAFLPQLELWTSLPDNEHILKLYGGSYGSKPQFYVCENAHNGNLAEFLEDEKRSGLYWQLFQ
ncbi:hypothetical protein PR003_g31176 [Phytophthora rubi]|uniref:Uncharacterized protein n=1 Tax=Phytophthora rubi TaxID=129364 RepID=A0A6A3GXG8_9STRA|nr:hypothetical protein PR002_g29900 [Phytophthora rubi]KAE8961550.1 hypothetical protein PR001_g30008 [Phytophthora rubi]KAE9269333.1 hypothetical protein PR003_g31176 [Phytophthora rubi]